MLHLVIGKRLLSALVFAVFMAATASAQNEPAQTAPIKIDSDFISGLGARNIGSATMSGRVAGLDAVEEKGRLTLYIGAASGGVWKSSNGGTTFKPVFDKQPVQSIGAVTIDPSNPKTIWVGTGEAWTRNSTSVGEGVYKSTNGGDDWTLVGLKDSERISRILVDPKNGDNVYVCATGHLWNDSDERGVYKTGDGGKTWNKILAGDNASSGCGMIAMSAKEPNTIWATMWDFRRQGWTFRSGGPGSGLFKSTDAGKSWKRLDPGKNGLPALPYGRIAVAVAPSDPKIVYAMIESKESALYRSDDGGQNWQRLDNGMAMIWRPFYFANMTVDPNDPMKLYKPGGPLAISTDGGKTFSGIAGNVHGDFHAVWVNPSNSNHVIVGDDGGAAFSMDGGNKWVIYENLPISQFYHVSYDMEMPYNVYGGLQDNSSWVAPSMAAGGIENRHWENMYGGDGFWMFTDPADQDYLYAEAQGGYIGRVNRKTHEARDIKPQPGAGEKKLRFNWNTPIHLSPNEKGTLYIGAQFLFRSRDHGQSWDRISPDLSTNDPEKQKQEESGGITVDNSAAEMHTSIYSISESPKNGLVIWAGTDDGNLQVTRDGAKTWTNVVANVPGLPKNSWVSTVEASRFDEGTAYATFDRHTYGDLKPYVFKTTDSGKTWASIVPEGSAMRGYAHVVKEDTVNKDLLFVGTEFGLWVSLDGGKQWAQFKGHEMPAVAVRDIAVHPRDSDLILATHGRGIWIVDDISPLRALTPEMQAKDATFIAGKPAMQYIQAQGGWANGDAMFTAPNPSDDAVINYYQKKRHIFGDLKLEIFDQQGKLLNTISGSKRRGLSRSTWSMRLKPPKFPPAASAVFGATQGPRVVPGTYTVKMTKNKDTYTTELKVAQDPRAKYSPEDRQQQFDLSMKLYDMLAKMTYQVDAITSARDAVKARSAKVGAKDPLRKRLDSLYSQLDAQRSKIVATKEGGMITGEERIREQMGELYGNVLGYEGRPTESQIARTDALNKELDDVVKDFDALATKELASLNTALARKKLDPVKVLTREEWEKKDEPSPGSAKSTAQDWERD